MICPKCSTENSERRRFCKECGFSIANFCLKCGFTNSLTDRYCGGCGGKIIGIEDASVNIDNIKLQSSAKIPGKYSVDDIKELANLQNRESERQPKKTERKEKDKVSQDVLDSLFDSGTKE